MTKLLKKGLLAVLALCLTLGAFAFAACGEEPVKEPETIAYTVAVSCDGLTASEIDEIGVTLKKADGATAATKKLSGGVASFDLAPDTYTVELTGDLLENYSYPATKVTKDSPSATVVLTAKSPAPSDETATYTVTVTGAEDLSGILVKLLKEDGSDATEAKPLTGGSATFELVPATYKVKLLGDALANYVYEEPTLTAAQTSATVALTAKTPEPPEGKIVYTVTVTCESVPTILTVISVELHTEDGPLAAEPRLLADGVATFTLEPGVYTVVLANEDDMLKDFEYDTDVVLTAEEPSVTIALTPRDNEPDGSEDYPFLVEGTLAGDYEFLPVKTEVEVGWDTYTTYSDVFYTYTPAADETYTFTTTVNYLGIAITDGNGATVFNNISGNDRFYKSFKLNAGAEYTMHAWADVENAPYHEGQKLVWKIESGEQAAPDVTYTVNVTCEDADVLASLSAQLLNADGSPAAEAKPLVNGSAEFSLAAGVYTVKLSGEGLDEFSYPETSVSQNSPVANIELVKNSHRKSFLGGDGSANSPYVVDPLTGVYSVPTNEFDSVYIEFTASAEGDYILTTEDDSLYIIIDQNGAYLVRFFYEGSDSEHPFHVAAGLVSMEVKNFDETNAPVTFTITRADGSFDPETSAPATPDLTAFVGTWSDDDGHKIVITENSLSYSENGDVYDTTIDGLENGILKFTYTEVLLGQETDYHYGLVFDGNALVLVNLEVPGTGKDYYNGYYVVSTLSKDGGGDVGGDVTVPDGLDGVWTAGAGETTIEITFAGTDVMMTLYDVEAYGAITAYDAESGLLTVTMEDDTEYTFLFEDGALTLYLDEGDGDYTEVPFTKGGSAPSVTLPEELGGVWTAYDETEEASYTLTFDGGKVAWETDYGFGFQMTDQGTVTSYNAETGMIEIELDENGSRTLFFVAQDNEITWTVGGDTVTFTKQGSAPSVTLPDGLDGVWEGIDDEDEGGYTLTVSGTNFTLEYYFSPVFTGEATAYDPQTGAITVTTDGGAEILTYKDGKIEYDFMGYLVVFTKQGGSSSVTLPEELTGVWSGEDEEGEPYVLTFDGLNVTYWGLSGTVVAYDGDTGVLTISLQSLMGGAMPFELLYDAKTHTIVDETFGVILTKQGGSSSVSLPDGLDGVWKGTDDEEMAYTLTFDGLNVTFVADEGGMGETTFTGKATAYDEGSKTLTFMFNEMGSYAIEFIFDPAAMTLTGSDDCPFPVTLTKEGAEQSEQDGSAEHPYVWDVLEGEHEIDLPAGTEQSQPSVYYSYAAKENGIYSLSYTLNGGKYNDLNLVVYAAGDSAHPVAAWNTEGQKYAFPLTAGVTYLFRLTDNSETGAGGKLLLTVTEEELVLVSAYQGSWSDAEENPSYTIVIEGTTVTVNGKTVSNLTLAPFNGGFNFIWEGKDCNISIGKTQAGGYESAMLFTFGSGEKDHVSLYHPGEFPAIEYGTEEHPMEMQQSDLAKDWSDRLSKGEYYWTFTASETKTYTLTTTIDYLRITLTDITAEKDVVKWSSSENLKEAVFEVTEGHVYLLSYTDSSSEDGATFKTVTFKIEEGGTIEKATLPQELLEVKWVNENPKNTITLTADEVKIHVDIQGILSVDYNGSVSKVEQTESGYTITFTTSSAKLSLTYNSADKTLTFAAPNEIVYTFTAKQGGGTDVWTGTLPDKWIGTWQMKDYSAPAPSQVVTISENAIVWTTGAGAGKTLTITGYDEENMIIFFKTDDGLTGMIEREFTWDVDTINAIKATIGGTTYHLQPLRQA